MVLISAGKLFKDSKIAWTRRASAIGSLKNFQVLIYTKLRKKSCFHLLIIYMKKKNKTKQNKARARILNFYLVYNFALVLHEKCLVSSQLEACRFFISIICRVFSRVFETIFWNYDNFFFGPPARRVGWCRKLPLGQSCFLEIALHFLFGSINVEHTCPM